MAGLLWTLLPQRADKHPLRTRSQSFGEHPGKWHPLIFNTREALVSVRSLLWQNPGDVAASRSLGWPSLPTSGSRPSHFSREDLRVVGQPSAAGGQTAPAQTLPPGTTLGTAPHRPPKPGHAHTHAPAATPCPACARARRLHPEKLCPLHTPKSTVVLCPDPSAALSLLQATRGVLPR